MIRKDFYISLCAALLALTLGGPTARAAGPAPVSSIDSIVSIAYQAVPGGDTQIVSSNDAGVIVNAPASGVALTPASSTQRIAPHTNGVILVTLGNTGTGTDTFALSVTSSPGWTALMVADTYGDGKLHAGKNTGVPAQVTLVAGGSLRFLLVMMPNAAVSPKPSATAVLKAVSGTNAATVAQASVTATIGAG